MASVKRDQVWQSSYFHSKLIQTSKSITDQFILGHWYLEKQKEQSPTQDPWSRLQSRLIAKILRLSYGLPGNDEGFTKECQAIHSIFRKVNLTRNTRIRAIWATYLKSRSTYFALNDNAWGCFWNAILAREFDDTIVVPDFCPPSFLGETRDHNWHTATIRCQIKDSIRPAIDLAFDDLKYADRVTMYSLSFQRRDAMLRVATLEPFMSESVYRFRQSILSCYKATPENLIEALEKFSFLDTNDPFAADKIKALTRLARRKRLRQTHLALEKNLGIAL